MGAIAKAKAILMLWACGYCSALFCVRHCFFLGGGDGEGTGDAKHDVARAKGKTNKPGTVPLSAFLGFLYIFLVHHSNYYCNYKAFQLTVGGCTARASAIDTCMYEAENLSPLPDTVA